MRRKENRDRMIKGNVNPGTGHHRLTGINGPMWLTMKLLSVCLWKKIKVIKCCTQNKELCKLLISKITVLVKNTTSGGE